MDATQGEITMEHDPYDKLDDDELKEKHEELLRLQEQDLAAGQHEGAKEMARERQLLWETAQERGVDL